MTQVLEDARGVLAKAAERAKRQDRQASAEARALAEGAAALKTQGEALDKRLRATGMQAEAAAEGMDPPVVVHDSLGGSCSFPGIPGSAVAAPYVVQPIRRRNRLGTDDQAGDVAVQLDDRHRVPLRHCPVHQVRQKLDLFPGVVHGMRN